MADLHGEPSDRSAERATSDVATGRPATARPATLVARSPVEAFLWVFITRLLALLSGGLSGRGAASVVEDDDAPTTRASDPNRAQRVRASRPQPTDPGPVAAGHRDADPDGGATGRAERNRAVAITTTAAVVGAAAAFAAGRRRGAR